jgi:DNA primase
MNSLQSAIKPPQGYSFPPAEKIVAVYDYVDGQGLLLFQRLRYEPKDFRTRLLDEEGNWVWGIKDSNANLQPVLFRLPQVIAAQTVVVVEGEKDAETASRLLPDGWAATTSPFGACQWREEYSAVLHGKQVYLCPDTDHSGLRHLIQVGMSLKGRAQEVRVIDLPKTVKDLTEWVEQGGQAGQFAELIQQARLFDFPRSNPDDARVNVQDLKGALDKLLKLKGMQYEWKEPAQQGNLTGVQMGLIAQDVEAVFPEWIGVDGQGYKTLTVRGFEALVVEAVKELKAENDGLRRRCEKLETKLKSHTIESVQ